MAKVHYGNVTDGSSRAQRMESAVLDGAWCGVLARHEKKGRAA
jgi:hypothetical protein